MRAGRQALLAALAVTLSLTGVVATRSTAAVPQTRHLLSVTSRDGRTVEASTTSGDSKAPPKLTLPTRSRVWFTVARKTVPTVFYAPLPRAAGRYLAFYYRDLDEGSAVVPDPGSTRDWPVVLTFGSGFMGFAPLMPGRVYSVDVAIDRPARVQMPFPMHVVKVRPESFPVAVVIHPIPLPAPVMPAVLDSASDTLGRLALSTTAVAIDWKTDPSPSSSVDGDACPSTSQTMSCTGSANMTYFEDASEFGTIGGPRQAVMGEAYDTPAQAPYISAYATSLPTPFDAATIYGFAMTPPGLPRL